MAVFVIGSMNIDMFFDVDHFVRAKETLLPDRCEVLPGGKGLNQACACSKAGAKTFMAGKIGSDRKILLDALNQARVDARFVQIDENDMSGRAIIQRDPSGENCILLVPGLNHALECEDFENVLEKIGENDIVLLQNEISNLCVLAKLLKKKGAFVVFNPAPVTDSIPKDLSFVSILVVNEVEIEQLLSKTGDPKKLCEEWLGSYPDSSIVLTLSNHGSMFANRNQMLFMPSFPVNTIDTTGAGDTYIGYFCALLDQGSEIESALQFASAAAALSVTRAGAATSIPERKEVEALIEKSDILCQRANQMV